MAGFYLKCKAGLKWIGELIKKLGVESNFGSVFLLFSWVKGGWGCKKKASLRNIYLFKVNKETLEKEYV